MVIGKSRNKRKLLKCGMISDENTKIKFKKNVKGSFVGKNKMPLERYNFARPFVESL